MKSLKLDSKTDLRWNTARDRGNYCEAYEGWSSISNAIEQGCAVVPTRFDIPPEQNIDSRVAVCVTWCAAFVLGFYGSFERHEIPLIDHDLFDAAIIFASRHNLDSGRDGSAVKELAIAHKTWDYQLSVGLLNQVMEEAKVW